MEKRSENNSLSSLPSTREQLLATLNEIVKNELGEDAFSFSMSQLNYYCNPNNEDGRFRTFTIPKKTGGQRQIFAPSPGLNNILFYVNILLKSIYKPSDYAMGFVEGRSVVDNAINHVGQNYVFNIDLKDFFSSIHQPRVWKRLQLQPFNFTIPVASMIAGLCCVKVRKEDGGIDYILPQGAPTSPLITNAICDKLDRRLAGLARRFNLHYSRYADDITFSSMHNVYQEGGEFRKELKRIIEGQNFRINQSKTRLQKCGERQEVTGLIVNRMVNTNKAYTAEIRNLLHIWEKYGYYDAYKRFYKKYKIEKGHVKKGEPLLENVLHGKLQYLKMVKGSKDPVYLALQARYNRLSSPLHADNQKEIDYLRSFNLSDFERIVGGEISYFRSEKDNLYGITKIADREIMIEISDSVRSLLLNERPITNNSSLVSDKVVDNSLLSDEDKSHLYVVLTASGGKAPFWMMTRDNPINSQLSFDKDFSITELLDIWEQEGLDKAMKYYERHLLK